MSSTSNAASTAACFSLLALAGCGGASSGGSDGSTLFSLGVPAERIDFEGVPAGSVLSTVFSDSGFGPIGVNATNPSLGATNAALVFDSSNPTGGDTDLGTPNQDFGGPGIGAGGSMGSPFQNDQSLGHVLIIAEDLVDTDGDGLVDDPDDADVLGSLIELDFSAVAPVCVVGMSLLDVEADRPFATVELFDQMGATLAVVNLPDTGNNGHADVNLGSVGGVWRMEVVLNGSGAIDNVVFRPVRGEIGDTVFCDLDDDGVQDAGEPGIAGVGVNLVCAGDDGVIGTADDTTESQTTDAGGMYLFTGLLPGLCEVGVDVATAPAGKVVGQCPTLVAVNLGVGESFLGADFCFLSAGEIGDTVYCDLDDNGVQDPGEPGIAGVTVNLMCAGVDGMLDTADDLLDSRTTDADGMYLFSAVLPDLCEVTLDLTTAPADKLLGQCPEAFVFDLQPGGSFLDADFCFIFPGEIGDLVWCDLDLDGNQDAGEPGVAGVVVSLACAGDDGLLGTTDDYLDSTVTDMNGAYLFEGVPPSLCDVTVDVTTAPAGKEPGDCPTTVQVDLAAGQSFTDADFCFRFPPGEIGDLVYCDLDDDGVHDAGEPGIAGVIVNLACEGIDGMIGTADDVVDSLTTDATGMYLFTSVPAGLCRVEVDVTSAPAGKTVGQCPVVVTVPLAPGESFTGADFCFASPPQGSIGDLVYCDLDDDGVQDPGEPGIAGVLVTLACVGPDGVFGTADDALDSQTTDARGMYTFTDVPPGLCTIEAHASTIPPDKEVGQCPVALQVDLQPGQSFQDADFCFRLRRAELGDFVWCDLDDDGDQDDGEPGVAGVLVSLVCAGPDGTLGTGDDVTDSQTTDGDGLYLFTDLPPGDCVVTVDVSTAPAGKVPGTGCPTELAVQLLPGQSFLGADFCFVTSGAIGDLVFCDLDGDGGPDPGEPGIEGVSIQLKCAGPDGILGTDDDVFDFAVTDSSGLYLFTGVTPGPCRVEVDVSSAPDNKEPGECRTALRFSLDPGEVFLDADFCFVTVGGEGCTPGYWKQPHHYDSWPDAFTPDMLFSDVFEDAFPGMTLVEVLGQGGGGLIALGRHTVAALLNAESDGVAYDLGMDDVVMKFNDEFPGGDYEGLKNLFESFNEQGCPLN